MSPATVLLFLGLLMLSGAAVDLRALPPAAPDALSGASRPPEDADDDSPETPGAQPPARLPARYGFGLLDRRSREGGDFFPDPFLGPEFDRETQCELDYRHGGNRGASQDETDAGLQWNAVGQLTLAEL